MSDESRNISCIPLNSEKFLTLSFSDIRFIDSLNFLNCSLDSLSKNLQTPDNKNIKYLVSEFPGISPDALELVKRKGIYPYEYMTGFHCFDDTSLPRIEQFYSSLTKSGVSVEDYAHATLVWNTFNCKTMRDYHDLYLKIDVLLLADVWQNFRQLCIATSGLEPTNYISLPSYGFDSLFRQKQYTAEKTIALFKEGQDDMFMWVEKSIRGGVSTITHRHAVADNKDMESHKNDTRTLDNPSDSTYIKYFDANNLYAVAMVQKLPTGDYKWDHDLESWTTSRILALLDDSDTGYIFEVDLEYPASLHDLHNDYPLAPENISIQSHELSAYSQAFLDQHDSVQTPCGKLIPNLRDKQNYTTHYRNLKLYLSLGLVLKRVHRVLSFTQSAFMKPFVEYNTKKRTEAKNDFEVDFYKLVNNSCFGKTMECVRDRVKYDLLHSSETKKFQKLVAKPSFKSWRAINDSVVGVERAQTEVCLDKPISVGFSILELAKVVMYDFHYNVIKRVFDSRARLLFTDTDSLCYAFKTQDCYAELQEYRDLFDNSNLDKSHRWYDPKNKKVIGKFKDETKGVEIKEFVGLRSKMYSYTIDDGKAQPLKCRKAKGISAAAVREDISHSDYLSCLTENNRMNVSLYAFRSTNHVVYTNLVQKIGLSSFDDKRYILPDGVSTLSYGHKDIKA
jgi:hypothetical protein